MDWKPAMLLLLPLIATTVAACLVSPAVSASLPPQNSSSDASLDSLTPVLNEFSVSLFDQLARASGQGNLVVSPVSLATSLSMLLRGARTSSADQLRSVLSLDRISNSSSEGVSVHQLFHQVRHHTRHMAFT